MRFALITLLLLLLAGPAWSSTISITPVTDNSACSGTGGGSCSGADYGAAWNTSGGTSSNLIGLGTTSTTMVANATTAVDGGGDTTKAVNFNHTYNVVITMDNPSYRWDLDLGAHILGLHAFRGDGTASAVGNQDDGNNSIGTVVTTVDGTNYNIGGSFDQEDCSNTCQKQQQFGSTTDTLNVGDVVNGVGSTSFAVVLDFDISAFSNDGCSGSICSSITGGEESALLFGIDNIYSQTVDNYGNWGRSVGPDGYTSTWTLNITQVVPEPSTALLLGIGMGGLALFGSRQRRDA